MARLLCWQTFWSEAKTQFCIDTRQPNGHEDNTPQVYYAMSGLVYSLAMICSNLALQFVSYPTQVIAKSCKPIPVMIFGVLLGKKSYSLRKYIFVGMVVFGVILFLYKDKKDKKEQNEFEGMGLGELLVLSSLFMDGVYSALQERMKADYQTKSLCMMTSLNKWATICLGILWVLTKEVFTFFAFLQRQPSVIWKLGALSICGFCGQFSMISMVTEFGTLPAAIVATIRKFFTVLVSVLLLGNTLLGRQWVATMIIFTGLFLDILYGKTVVKSK
ncbi:hypothetical protein RUM44_001671 [Polyplax serrata]|uniref:Uncharacterized protein n=1 Tax=Polyplax serrata TaxID=468196 RepID=A0ABR1AM85_POLSC